MEAFKSWLSSTEHGLVIAPRNMHETLLEWLGEAPLKQIQIMDETEWLFAHGFTLKPQAKGRVMETFDLTSSVVDELLSALRHIDDVKDGDELRAVNTFLIQHGLKEKGVWMDRPLSPSLCVIDIYETPLFKHRLDTIYQGATITKLKSEKRKHSAPYVSFESAYQEVEKLAETLSEALLSGTDINTLKVHATQAEYHDLIALIFPRYQIPYQILEPISFKATPLYQTLIEVIDQSIDLDSCTKMLKKILTKNDASAWLVQPVSKSLLDLEGTSYQTAQGLLKEALKKLNVPHPKVKDAVDIGDYQNGVPRDLSLYVLGAAEGDLPGRVNTSGYLSDTLLKAHHLDTLESKVKQGRFKAEKLLMAPSLKWVSFSSKLLTSEKIPSLLVDMALKDRTLHHAEPTSFEHRHSTVQDFLTYQKALDAKRLYNQDHPHLPHFLSTPALTEIKVPTFKRKQAPLDPKLNEALLEKRSQISYSRMEDYFKCEFRFLLKNLLGVEETFADKLPALIGNLYHESLALIDTLPEDTHERYTVYFNVLEAVIDAEKETVSMEERFFLYNVLEGLDAFIQNVKAFHQESMYEPFAYEKEIEVDLGGKHLKKMVGIVDKIMHDGEKFAIIDYKSSPRDIKLSKYEYALGSQLPFYMSLVQEYVDELNHPIGFFYHPFTLKIEHAETGKDHAELQAEHWKLEGHIDETEVEAFDPTYEASTHITGMGTIKNGDFRKSAKTLTPGELKSISDLIKRRVDEAIKGIESGEYPVNPKGTPENTPSCQYCEFKDICYKRPSDFKPFSTSEDESFLAWIKSTV